MVVTGTRREVEWITRDMGRSVPDAWERFRDGVAAQDRDADLADAYARLLESGDPHPREQAAIDWCAWEDTHVAVLDGEPAPELFDAPEERLAFARLVTHHWRHACFLEDGQLMRNASRLAGIPGTLVHGRLDLSSPVDVPWQLHHRWPGSELVIVDRVATPAGTACSKPCATRPTALPGPPSAGGLSGRLEVGEDVLRTDRRSGQDRAHLEHPLDGPETQARQVTLQDREAGAAIRQHRGVPLLQTLGPSPPRGCRPAGRQPCPCQPSTTS
jgi:hypothetical protein